MMWYGNYGLGMGYGYGLFSVFFMLLWWAFIIFVLINVVKWMRHNNFSHGGGRAMDILDERYAKGEINKAEYEEKKKDLLKR